MPTTVDTKQCGRCREARPRSDFNTHRRSADGLQPWCKQCKAEHYLTVKATPERFAAVQAQRQVYYEREKAAIKERTRQRRQAEPEQHREAARDLAMRYRYGITLEQYEAMCAEVDNRCPLCGEQVEKLHVDHDHETGRVRGLLCGPCNRALGFVDRADWLARALAYLQSERTKG